jgi:hypothetical protein
MLAAIKEILRSKKALVALLSVAVWVAGRFGAELAVDELLPAVAPLWAYVLGQGWADSGKEAAKIDNAPAAESAPPA